MRMPIAALLGLLLLPSIILGETVSYLDGPIHNMYFVVIPEGSFQMGSPLNEVDRIANEGPQHSVHLNSFEMMATEVTQGMWEEVMGTTMLDIQALSDRPRSQLRSAPNCPMAGLSYYDCLEFIEALNRLDTLYVYRLPSESEWEYSCRAGTATAFYWGNDTRASVMNQYCWSDHNTRNLKDVAQLLPNSWGLFDMSGSVWEWTADWWNDSYANLSGAPVDGSAWTQGNFGDTHILRGGTVSSAPAHCRSSVRNAIAINLRYPTSGFRLVRESASFINSELIREDGDTHLFSMEFNEAMDCYNEALSINPTNATAFMNRGYLHSQMRNYEEAISDYETAMNIDERKQSTALYNIACVYGLSSNPEMAIEFLEDAVEKGFSYIERIETDTDFDLVRDQVVFSEGLARIRQSINSHDNK